MSRMERQALGEVAADEIMFIPKPSALIRGQQQASVVNPASGENYEARAYHHAVATAADRDDAVHTPTGRVNLSFNSTRLQQQTHIGRHREDVPSIVKGGHRELEDAGL